jgi:hypothetical protein
MSEQYFCSNLSCKNTAKIVKYGTLSLPQGKEILSQLAHHSAAICWLTMVNIQIIK